MQLPRKQKEYKPRKVQSMDTYRSLFRFHDENVAWMSEYFLGENTETRGDALSNKQRIRGGAWSAMDIASLDHKLTIITPSSLSLTMVITIISCLTMVDHGHYK